MNRVFAVLVAWCVCLVFAGSVHAGTVKMKAAHYFDEDHAYQKGLEKFRDVIRAKSNGTLDMEIYSRGVLGSMKDYFQNMLQGALDVSIVAPPSAAGFAKELNFLDLLFLWKDKNHWLRSLDGDVGQRISAVIEKATARGGSAGVKILGYVGASPRHIISRKQGYTTVAEMAGFKIRLQESATQIEMFKMLGTIPAVVPYQETYSAVQTGVVDGLENEMSTAFQMKFYEVAPYFSETGHVLTVRPLFMSAQTWKNFSADQQAVVMAAAKEATALIRTVEWRQDDEAIEQMKKLGTKFYAFKEKSKMMDITLPVRQRAAKDFGMADILDMIEQEAKR